MGGSFLPREADSVLVVDPNAVLSFAITFQRFQPVSLRHGQIFQLARDSKPQQSDLCRSRNRFESLDPYAVCHLFGVLVPKRGDHQFKDTTSRV